LDNLLQFLWKVGPVGVKVVEGLRMADELKEVGKEDGYDFGP
jgi:hypothetical protein